jgi:hypothetical protein
MENLRCLPQQAAPCITSDPNLSDPTRTQNPDQADEAVRRRARRAVEKKAGGCGKREVAQAARSGLLRTQKGQTGPGA